MRNHMNNEHEENEEEEEQLILCFCPRPARLSVMSELLPSAE